MLPDPWTLAFALVGVSGLPDAPALGRPQPSALQADAAEAAPPSDGADAPAEPPAADAPAEPTAPSEPPPAEAPAPAAPPTDAAPSDGSVGAFPDAAPASDAAAPDATAPETGAEEPRTWNDPTAAAAAAETDPSASTPPPEEDLGDEPLEPSKQKKDPKGFGMAMVGALTFSPAAGHEWAQGNCPSATIDIMGTTAVFAPTGCSASPSAGFSAEGRFGYMINVIGFELYGQTALDYVNAKLDGVPPIPGVPDYATQMHIGRIGIGGGGHLRLKTPPGPFRLSGGAGGGFLVRALFSNVSSLDGSSETYVAPVLRADLGIVLASVFTLGIMGWLEFAPTVTITPDLSALGPGGSELNNVLTDTVVVQGTQGTVGLFGGFAFGK